MMEHDRSVASFKDFVSARSLHADHPQIPWIQLPMHDLFPDNGLRYKFNKSLEEIARLHNNVYTLALKKVWDSKDTSLFIREFDAGRFTSIRLKTYWEAVDRTVRYFGSVILKKQFLRKTQKPGTGKNSVHGQKDQKHDRFRW